MACGSTPRELRKFFAPEFVFGAGALELAGRYAQNLGARQVLVVSDPGVRAAGWLDQVAASLEGVGLPWTCFDGVSPNPRAEEVAEGARFYAACGADVILALGGGSPMDCAKGILVVAANGGDVRDYEGVDEVAQPGPPLICIPTTAGTAADVSQFAIISDRQAGRKFAIISRKVVPDVALIDPRTLDTASPFLRACTGMDALTHAAEALVSNAGGPLTELHALEAVRLVADHLQEAVEKGTETSQEGMMRASLEAGLAFSNASLGAVHAMAHALGGLMDLPHGLCNALLLPHVVAFNFAESSACYALLARALGVEGAGREELVRALLDLNVRLGIRQGLGDLGVTREALGDLARTAHLDPCLVTNPRAASPEDLEVVYAEAL